MFQMKHSAVSTDIQRVEKQSIKKWLKSERKKSFKTEITINIYWVIEG